MNRIRYFFPFIAIVISINLVFQTMLVPVIFAQESTESATPAESPVPESTPEPTPEPTPPVDVAEILANPDTLTPIEATPSAEVINEADFDNVASISAQTGTNTASGSGTAIANTGDAAAIANIVNAINTNLQESEVAFIALTPSVNEAGDIDLNELWQQLQILNNIVTENSSEVHPLTLTFFNTANVKNLIIVKTGTGNNDLTSDAVSLETGNAISIANVGQLINANLFNAQVLFSFINILPGFVGNIILPRPPTLPASSPNGYAFTTNTNASTSASMYVDANTGQNLSEGESTTTTTGDASSFGSLVGYIDTVIINSFLYSFVINNLSDTPVDVVGWSEPIYSNILEFFNPINPPAGSDPADVNGNNQANVVTTIISEANTGINQVKGAVTSITTGTAKAVATLLEFTNLSIFNGQLFTGAVNITGDWLGKIIIAHPDLATETTPIYTEAEPGSEISFSLTMANIGHDIAREPVVTFSLPPQVNFTGSSCAFPQTVVGQTITWQLPTLPKNSRINCTVTGQVADNFSFENTQAGAFSLVKQVYAASHTHTQNITASAYIESADPELYTGNNSSTGELTIVKTEVNGEDDRSDNTTDTLPQLVISAGNNVNEYVYAGDTVTFFINVTNTGDVPARDTILNQTLYGPDGEPLGTASFNLGTINTQRGGKLTFGITLPADIATGVHTTTAQAFAESDQGTPMASNQSQTSFRVIGSRVAVFTGTVQAADNTPTNNQPQILGLAAPICELPFNPIPYVMIVVLNAAWFAWTRRRWLPSTTAAKTLFAGTSTLMIAAALYAVYVLGNHYNFFPNLPWMETINRALLLSLSGWSFGLSV